MTNPESRQRSLAIPFAVAITLLQAVPWLLLLVNRVSLIACAAESIGYRYFHSFRILHGDHTAIWEAQGQTLGVIVHLINWLLDLSHCTDLQLRIAWFGYSTLALNTAIFIGVLVAFCRSPVVTWADRWLVAAVALFGVYGSRWGMAAAWLPDYYTLEVTASVAGLGLFIVYLRTPDARLTAVRAALLGLLAGALVGIKITLLPAALLPLVVLGVRDRRRPARGVAMLGVWGTAAALLFGAVVSIYYRFDFVQLAAAFRAWRTFVAHPGAEPGFVASLLGAAGEGRLPWMHHLFVGVILVLWLAALGVLGRSLTAPRAGRAADAITAAFITGSAAMHLLGLWQRPAETTLFECGLFLAVSGAALMASLPAAAWYRRLTNGWSLLLLLWTLASAAHCLPSPATVAMLRTTGDNAWALHRWLNRTGLPVVVLLPDNRYASGTVEEALLKGFSDTPTWQITRGYDLLEKVAPRRQFEQQFAALPVRGVVVWTDAPHAPLLSQVNPELREALQHPAAPPRAWAMGQNAVRSFTVHAAVLAAALDRPVWRIVRSNQRWRGSTSGAPIGGFQVSPLEARPRIELHTEGDHRFVRITATRASPYLALSGDLSDLPGQTGPILLEAVVRLDRARTFLLQLYGSAAGRGAADNLVQSNSAPAGDWVARSAEKPANSTGFDGDNFSVGLVDVQAGDWFDVAELNLLTRSPAPATGGGLP